MNTYVVEVTLRGGFYAGQRRKFAVGPIEAASKDDAAQKAMDLVASDKTVGEYDSMHAGKIRLCKSSPSPTLAGAKYSQGEGESLSKCPQCHGETELNGNGGIVCFFCGYNLTK